MIDDYEGIKYWEPNFDGAHSSIFYSSLPDNIEPLVKNLYSHNYKPIKNSEFPSQITKPNINTCSQYYIDKYVNGNSNIDDVFDTLYRYCTNQQDRPTEAEIASLTDELFRIYIPKATENSFEQLRSNLSTRDPAYESFRNVNKMKDFFNKAIEEEKSIKDNTEDIEDLDDMEDIEDIVDSSTDTTNKLNVDDIDVLEGLEDVVVDPRINFIPHYEPFFDINRGKIHRINHKDVRIEFGNHAIIKTIKDVFMRSVNVEIDGSGNPIFEVYEFVARDLVESDEPTDADRYPFITNSINAPADIKYSR